METFLIHSTTRSPKTRLLRARAAQHPRHTRFILDTQRRLIPNRPVAVSKDELLRNLPALKELHSQGILEVKTPTHQLVDLDTIEAMAPPADPPLPKRVLDSIANDPPRGRTFLKTDLRADVDANPSAPVQVRNTDPVPALLPLPQHPGVITPAVPPIGPAVVDLDNLPVEIPEGSEELLAARAVTEAAAKEETPKRKKSKDKKE